MLKMELPKEASPNRAPTVAATDLFIFDPRFRSPVDIIMVELLRHKPSLTGQGQDKAYLCLDLVNPIALRLLVQIGGLHRELAKSLDEVMKDVHRMTHSRNG